MFGVKVQADPSRINRFYAAVLKSPDPRIFFTNGSIDFWALLSVLPQDKSKNPAIDSMTLTGYSHTDDLSIYNSPILQSAWATLVTLVQKWN